jgi:hypothetical protein
MKYDKKTLLHAAICGFIKGAEISVDDAFKLLDEVRESIASKSTALAGDKHFEAWVVEVAEDAKIKTEKK